MTTHTIRDAQTSDDILPGPFSEDDLRQQWNAQADEFNQWDQLATSEQLAWAQARAIGGPAMIVPTANYPTSRDYGQLWELAHVAAIVCIVDLEPGKPGTCRDIARTTYSPEWAPEMVQVGSRGIGHVWAESLEAFIAQCEHCNLEWLVPPVLE